MLDESEWTRLVPELTRHIEKIKQIRKELKCDMAKAHEFAGKAACDLYFEMTGYRETNSHALWHHRLAQFGKECPKCGQLFRTPEARFCANCGMKKKDAEKFWQ